MADISIHGEWHRALGRNKTALNTDREWPNYDNSNSVRLDFSGDTFTIFCLDRPTADALTLVARMTTEQRAEAVGLMRAMMEDRRDA
jgi:hypothetical protein